jgi:hypothetical protein
MRGLMAWSCRPASTVRMGPDAVAGAVSVRVVLAVSVVSAAEVAVMVTDAGAGYGD